MRIAQVVCAYPPYAGGIGNSAHHIAQLLGRDHEIITFSPQNLRPWLKYGHGAFLPQLLWRLRKFDYIYLHYPFFGSAEIIWLFKIFCRQPKLIVHYHMDVKNLTLFAKLFSLPSLLIRPALLRQAKYIVSASLDYVQASQIKKYYRSHPEKFREIPFSVDPEKYCPKMINRPTNNKLIAKTQAIIHYINDQFIKRNRLHLLFVGGLDRAHYFKGLPVLLEAVAALNFSKWSLTIVGDGDLRPKYEAQAARLNLATQIIFTGKLSEKDLIRAYQNADLLILPSINNNEAFGLVLIEALACGVPVIASNLPGVRRVFDNLQQGLLIEPNQTADLTKKIAFIHKNEELRRVMSLAARRLVLEKYTETHMRAALLKIIH